MPVTPSGPAPWPAPHEQLPPPMVPSGVSPPIEPVTQRRRFRARWIVLLAAAAVVALGAGTFLLVALDRTALRHDLVTADFDTSAAPFETGETAQFRAFREDGSYVIEATEAPDGPASSFAMFTRTAFDVTVAATVLEVVDDTDDAAVGVACMDLPETNGHGYIFAASDDEVALVRTDKDGWTTLLSEAHPTGSLSGRRLQISCHPTGSTVELTGSIDGNVVITTADEDGVTSFSAAMLVFHTFDAGDRVRFDDVDARVPGA